MGKNCLIRTCRLAIALCCVVSAAFAISPTTYRRPVTIWIPGSGISRSVTALTEVDFAAGITHLDLQFWVPTKEGGVRFENEPDVNDAAVIQVRDWAQKAGVRVLLCVFNGERNWDWPLAKAAFADNEQAFVDALVAEMQRLKLDGIDIDLEGPSDYEVDKPAYVKFVKDLSKRLRHLRKALTVDSFAYVWNAPNQEWWPDLFPSVDAITSMGYEQIGSTATDWKSYDAECKAAGKWVGKLQIGVPSGRNNWMGNTALEQLEWIRKSSNAGVGIWDARLRGSDWKSKELWQSLAGIRSDKRN